MKYNLGQIAGLFLWWTEGTKSMKDKRWKNSWSYPIMITNTDPDIIQLFLTFLRKDVEIDESKLKLQLQIHEGDDQKELENYWSNITKIPKTQFNKTIVRPKGNKPGKTKGTCKIRFQNKQIYLKLKNQLENLLNEIKNNTGNSVVV